MDKKYQKSLANKVGLKTSDGWLAINNNGVYCIPEGVKYPCFTKPLESYSDGHLKHYLLKCDTESELQTVLNSIAKENHKLPILIEKYNRIDKEYAILGLSLGNKAIIPSVIQMGTSQNGLTATGTIFPISKIPQLREQLVEFMKETQLTGLFDIDMYESDGQLYFNELNVRFGASGFALNHIINLPQILVHYLLSKEEKGLCVDLPVFKEHTLASEKVLRNMYLDGTISFFKYRNFIRKADILSIESNEDVMPQRVFSKKEKHLPFIKAKLLLKNRLKVIK